MLLGDCFFSSFIILSIILRLFFGLPGFGVSVFNISKSFENYGTIQYNAITHTKMHILKYALSKYNFVHFIDCDVVCMKEPTKEHYNKYANYDIVFQYDCGMYSPTQLTEPTLHTIWTCTGNTTLRNSPETQMLLNKIIEYQNIIMNKWEIQSRIAEIKQMNFNKVYLS